MKPTQHTHLIPSARKALMALRAAGGGWISGNRLADAAGYRFSARLHELRAAGYVIERRTAADGSPVDWYRLVEKPEQMRMAI